MFSHGRKVEILVGKINSKLTNQLRFVFMTLFNFTESAIKMFSWSTL